METKIVTSINQSKKLIELGLSADTADMYYDVIDDSFKLYDDNAKLYVNDGLNPDVDWKNVFSYDKILPAWSLSALLDILPFPQLSKDKLGSGKVGWMVSVYPDNCRYDSCWHDNPIDAAFEMMKYVLENKNPKSEEEQIKELAELKNELLNGIK